MDWIDWTCIGLGVFVVACIAATMPNIDPDSRPHDYFYDDGD